MTLPRRSSEALERQANQLKTYALFVKDPVIYDELQAKIWALLAEAERLRKRAVKNQQ